MAISSLSITTLKSASAQSIPTPSVPEFTVKVVAYPYYVAPTTTIDPYTGQNETTQAGYYVENMSIVVTIESQPFSYSYNGTTYNLYYDVQEKPHFEMDWYPIYSVSSEPSSEIDGSLVYSNYISPNAPLESNSDYTVLSYPVGVSPFAQLPPNAQIDFQVEALVGHYSEVYNPPLGLPYYPPNDPAYYSPATALDASSGWSNTVTITVVNGGSASSTSASTTPNPTPTLTPVPSSNSTATSRNPTVGLQTKTGAGLNWLEVALFVALAVIVALVVVVVAMTVRHRKPLT
jgi:hypothetical protein